jgi:hypothetical protein
MNWHRWALLPLAAQDCALCSGLGYRVTMRRDFPPCRCVLRHVFRACLTRYREVTNPWSSSAYLPTHSDYAADFAMVAKRTLGADTLAYRIFATHFLRGCQWRECCARLGVSHHNFWRLCARLEERLGFAYGSTAPCALFPLDEYFSPTLRGKPSAARAVSSPSFEPLNLS